MAQDQHQDRNTAYQSRNERNFQPNDPVVHVFLPNTPLMQVVEPVRLETKIPKEKKLGGIRCCWFAPGGIYCSEIFNSRSIRHAKPSELPIGYVHFRAIPENVQ